MDLTKYKFNSKEEKVKVWEDTWNTIIKEG